MALLRDLGHLDGKRRTIWIMVACAVRSCIGTCRRPAQLMATFLVAAMLQSPFEAAVSTDCNCPISTSCTCLEQPKSRLPSRPACHCLVSLPVSQRNDVQYPVSSPSKIDFNITIAPLAGLTFAPPLRPPTFA